MALTNRVSVAGGADTVAGLAVVVGIAISELEVNECATLGREEAKVQDHERGAANTHEIGFEDLPEARVEQKLIQPDQARQEQHERGYLWRVPSPRDDASDNQRRVAQ